MAGQDPFYEQIADVIKSAEPDLKKAEDYIAYMKSVGENTAEMEAKVRQVRNRIAQHKQSLKSRGMVI